MSAVHPFDEAIALTGGPTTYQGRITPAYGNMVGPYGGAIGGALLNAVLSHPERQGDPLSITVNYAAPLADAPFDIAVTLVRSNRSTQHWQLLLSQESVGVAISATAITAKRRESWSQTESVAPNVQTAADVPVMPNQGMPAWVSNYEMRMLEGAVTMQPDNASEHSRSRLWVKDTPGRPLDFCSLLAISDCFFPRIFVRKQQMLPAGTITLTTYFHTDAAGLKQQDTAPLLAEAKGQRFYNGFFDQSARLWGTNGELLATSHQLVYFKA